jgi:hypothetical protein
MDVRFSTVLAWMTVLATGCGATPAPVADRPGCVLEPALLQRCDPPALPTVQTFEQIDAAVTEAYVCTNQLNAQLAEILRRCGAGDREPRQASLLPRQPGDAELDL